MGLRSSRSSLAVLAAAVIASALVPVLAPATAAAAGPAAAGAPGAAVQLLAGDNGPETFVAPLTLPGGSDGSSLTAEAGAQSATIVVTYDLDFDNNPAAKAAFQAAIDLWEQLIVSPVTINITADFNALPSNVLGSAGPDRITRGNCPAMTPDTWYPAALGNAICGLDIEPPFTEAGATFNSTRSDWYFGTDGQPGSGKYDFMSVVMHETGHMLGFLGSMVSSEGFSPKAGSWGYSSQPPVIGDPRPLVYDRFAENAADGTGNVLWTDYPNGSIALGNQLRSDSVYFVGPNTTTSNGGNGAKLYAPASWSQGSSFSHLDETTFNGTDDALMTPILGQNEAIHSPGFVALAMFEDMGWQLPVAPDPPTGVGATAGSNAAKVTFVPPLDNGGSAITSYTVTASPGGATGVGLSSPVWVAGLANGTPYTFTVVATNAFGDSTPAGPTLGVTPALHAFHAVDPVRILDTRYGFHPTLCPTCQPTVGARAFNSNTQIDVTSDHTGTVPLSPVPQGADVVVLNVTATQPTGAGWLTVWDTGPVPLAANLNFVAGQTVPNSVTVKLNTDGTVRLGNTNGAFSGPSVHVVIDVIGWYDDGVVNTSGGTPYQPVAPERILDTRFGTSAQCPTCQPIVGARGPQSDTEIDVAGEGGVPPGTDAVAVVFNVAVTAPTKPGWITLWPDGPVPNAANLNFVAGQTVANLVTVKLNTNGKVHVGNSIGNTAAGSVHVIIDVVGWYGATATGGGINAATPERILDTRFGVVGANPRNTPLVPQEQATIPVSVPQAEGPAYGRVPGSGVGTVIVNVTAIGPSAAGWFTVWPGGTIPNAANLNFLAGKVVPNLVIVGLGALGDVKLGNTVGCACAGYAHAVFDVSGWFAPPPPP